MKRLFILATGILALSAAGLPFATAAAPSSAHAAVVQPATAKTETFAVENMTCALCPVTVRKAMAGVRGVRSVAVHFDTKLATVIFDPSKTTADAIAAASTNAGYPAMLKH